MHGMPQHSEVDFEWVNFVLITIVVQEADIEPFSFVMFLFSFASAVVEMSRLIISKFHLTKF